MHYWLQNFEYRITIQWWIFMLAAFIALAVAAATISFNAIKAAIENPIKSLKNE